MQSLIALIAAGNSNDDLFIILTSIISFIWVSLFTLKALRHAEEELYPAVTLVAFAWPSYMFAFSLVIIILSFFGVKLQ